MRAMRFSFRPCAALVIVASACAGCGESLPPDLAGYESSCVKLNRDEIPPYEGDPHAGFKNVFACNVPQDALEADERPFPDGTIIIKESRRQGQDFTWLVAVARKEEGRWRWDEYTRNFGSEDHVRLLLPQSKCTNCHERVSSRDYIYTGYEAP